MKENKNKYIATKSYNINGKFKGFLTVELTKRENEQIKDFEQRILTKLKNYINKVKKKNKEISPFGCEWVEKTESKDKRITGKSA